MSDGMVDYDELSANPSLFVESVLDISPFNYQKSFLDADSRYRSLVSGRQVGKSRMCAWWGLYKAMTNPHSMTLITAPSQRQSSLLFKQLRSEMSQSGIADETWGVTRDTQTIIEFDNGAEIHCLPTGRDGSNIRGYSADTIIVDEAAFIANPIFEDVLEPMIFATGGDLVLASTPFGTSGYFYKMSTKWGESDADDEWSSWDPETGGISSDQNPLIDDDDIERFKEGKTQRQIKQEVLGEFVQDGSQFFGTQTIQNAMPGGEPEYDNEVPCYLGADIASAGADETIFTLGDANGRVFEIEDYANKGVLDAADRIQVLDNMYGFQEIVVDETGIGRGTAEELGRKANVANRVTPVYLSLQKKQAIYQGLKAALEQEELYLPHNNTLRLQLEAIGYSKTKSNNLSLHAEDGFHDDYVDSLALCTFAMPDTIGGNNGGAKGATTAVTADPTQSSSNASSSNGSYRNSTRSTSSRNARSRTNKRHRDRKTGSRRRR